MRRVFINEWKMAINISTVIAIIGVMFCICFDSWNDLTGAIQSGNTVWCVYCFQRGNAKIWRCEIYGKYSDEWTGRCIWHGFADSIFAYEISDDK